MTERELARLIEAVRNIGNGDFLQGEIVVLELSEEMHRAREKHPWPSWIGNDHMREAAAVVALEASELYYAACHQSEGEAMAESAQKAAAAIRFRNREWETA